MANTDINPPAEFIAAYSLFPQLLGNEAIKAAFAVDEARAVRAKSLYTWLGRCGLVAAFISFTAVIYIVTIEHFFFEAPKFQRPSDDIAFKVIFFIVGLGGVLAQMLLLFSPIKRIWLNARFRAERLRSIKFMAFQAAICGGDAAVAPFTARALAHLSADSSDEADTTASRHNFNPAAALLTAPGAPCLDGPALQQVREAYIKLRLERQAAFANHEIKRLSEERKLPASSSELAFWIGAGLAFADAILTFIDLSWQPLRPLLHFLTLELFVISALLFVHERGRSYTSALERYEDYREEMLRLSERMEHADTPEEFQRCVQQTELLALKELKLFCREAERSTYLI